jgi:hypothetical protein
MLNTLAGIIASSGGAVAGGDYESIATVTVGSGGSSSISFTSIPSTYKHLQVRFIARTNRGTYGFDDLKYNFNSDTGANYTYHELWGNGSSANAAADINFNYALLFNAAGTSVSGTWYGSGITDILDYGDTNKFKTMRTLNGIDFNGAAPGGLDGRVNLASNLWRSTSAITRIDIASGTGNTLQQYSSFALYGIKG